MSDIKNKKKITREELKRQIEKMREADSQMVTGIFENKENEGGTITFSYKKYPQDKIETYTMTDGKRYTIPKGVAKHLNNQCYYKEYLPMTVEGSEEVLQSGHSPDARGRSKVMQMSRKIHRYGFKNLEFMEDDYDNVQRDAIEVTHV